MKVGIMSMQRIANYGSFLQAYALKKIISGLGHSVTFVDYHTGDVWADDRKMPKTEHKGDLRFFAKYALKKMLGKEIYFDERYKVMVRKLGVGEKMRYNTKTDTLVIGSDEVFNCLQSNPDVGFSPELFGKNANAKRVITYAASFGHTTAEGLKAVGKYEEVKEYIKELDAVSVRDENSANIVSGMGITTPKPHLDPVLIYGFGGETIEKNELSDYILVYSYAGRISDEKEIAAIKNFARAKEKKIVTVGFHQPWSDIKLEGDPFELLGYFKNADYVVTDTFHGTIFSVINRKKFATLIRATNKEKLTSLLKTLKLEERIVTDTQKLEEILCNEPDYAAADEVIAEERRRTLNYLKENL